MDSATPLANGTPTAAATTPTPQAHALSSSSNGASSDHPIASTKAAAVGDQCLAEMNIAFAKCLSLVCPPIQYPPHCRFNPVQQDAADMTEIEARLEEFFVHAKQIELLFLRDANDANDANASSEQRHDLELEIHHLENELNEKNDLIEKYHDVIRGWEGKFKRLDSRMAPDRE